MNEKIEELLNEGKSVMHVAAELGISMEEVINNMSPHRKGETLQSETLQSETLQESTLKIVASQNILFLVIGDKGPLLVCGNAFTFDLIKNRWGEGAKFYLIGAATIGMSPGIVGQFSSVTVETFQNVPEIK